MKQIEIEREMFKENSQIVTERKRFRSINRCGKDTFKKREIQIRGDRVRSRALEISKRKRDEENRK